MVIKARQHKAALYTRIHRKTAYNEQRTIKFSYELHTQQTYNNPQNHKKHVHVSLICIDDVSSVVSLRASTRNLNYNL